MFGDAWLATRFYGSTLVIAATIQISMPFPHNAPTDTKNISSHANPMSPAEQTPLLHLSDIMHHLSPSPISVEHEWERSGSATPRGPSPEPVSETEALGIRRRLEEMGIWKSARDNLSSREKELVDMVRFHHGNLRAS